LEEILKRAGLCKGEGFHMHPHVICSDKFVKDLLRDNSRTWCLEIGERPSVTQGWCDLVLEMVFLSLKTIYKV
jgi:hypothetical protein